MKFLISRTRRGVVAGGILLLVASCGGDSTGPDLEAVAQVSVTAQGVTTIPLAGTVQLSATLLNELGSPVSNQNVSWSSQDTSVATVNAAGLVTGVGVGMTAVTASGGGRTGQIQVTVFDPNPPAAPSGLAATVVSDTRIDLTWTANSTNEDEFRVEREAVGAGAAGGGVIHGAPAPPATAASGPSEHIAGFTEVAVVGAGVTAYSDTGLSPEQTYRYRVRACNDNGCSDAAESVEAATFATLAIATSALPGGTVGVSYSATLAAGGGDGDPQWSLASGSLPPGLSLSAQGVLSGTPTEAGTFSFTVRAEGGGQTAERALGIEVGTEIVAPVVTTSSLPDGRLGESYSATLEASQGDGSYAWAIVAGGLPVGLSLDAGGGISGTPTDGGTFAFTVQVTSAGLTGEAELEITVDAPPVEITSDDLPGGAVGQIYQTTLAAMGGDGTSYQWTVSAGELPPGLSLVEASGQISGTPALVGTYGFTIEVTSAGQSASKAFEIEIEVGQVIVTTSSLPGAVLGQAYEEFLTATGGDGTAFSWSVTDGAIPTGLALDGGIGRIAGTPTASGTFNFTVQASAGGETGQRALSIEVTGGIAADFDNWYLPVATPGNAYEYDLRASGGDGANYTFTLVDGALPTGMSLDAASGTISGSASQPGTYFFEVEVESAGATSTRVFALTVSTVSSSGFNIAVLNAAGEAPSAAFRTALDDALAKWEEAITTNFPPFTMPGTLPPDLCQGHGEKLQVDETIQDLVILLDVRPIDGAGGTIARAGPCGYFLGSPALFRAGSLVVDSDDVGNLDAGQLLGMLIHEIGHIVGIGTLWDFDGRTLITGKGSSDPRFVGVAGVDAYEDLGGTDDDIPVENQGGSGTRDAHWRQAVFQDEVMTSFIAPQGVPMPMSIMTIQSVADLGYSVNPGAADSYSLPSPDLVAAGAPGAAEGWIHLHDDVVIEPVLWISPDGSIHVVYPSRE